MSEILNMTSHENETTKWHRELDIFSKVKTGLILEGNVNDIYAVPQGEISIYLQMTEYLHRFYEERGYQVIVDYTMINGFTASSPEKLDTFCKLTGAKKEENHVITDFSKPAGGATEFIEKLIHQTQSASVVIMDMASRYITSPDRLSKDEVQAFARIQRAMNGNNQARGANGWQKNIIIMICNKQNDLPAWFFLDNPNVKTIHVAYPNAIERRMMVSGKRLQAFFDPVIYQTQISAYLDENGSINDDLKKLTERFVARTEGMTNVEMDNLRNLCRMQKINIKDLCTVVDLYTYGIQDNPWERQELLDSLQNAEERILDRVKGQTSALKQTLDVIKRSVMGLSGTQHSSNTKPKGILFFAGPTGTGKTETAKTLAELIFGDEKSCIRFDMSEYSQSHSDQRLLGAPPGYVGYEAGGQLTNAIRKNPFSILLFDEIEKAAPSIMDKFLQILEDGRMTDGQGNTVYFSECIIIFTSNLGITVDDGSGHRIENVAIDMPYETVERNVRSAIEDHFKLRLGRPEILNRIGENIVVFDFIRPDVAKSILHSRLIKMRNIMAEEKHIELEWDDSVEEKLYYQACNNLANGGRGIMNVVEHAWINPISRFLFDQGFRENVSLKITDILCDQSPVEIRGEVASL